MFFRNADFVDGGRAVLIEPPTDPAITLADAKKALGISDASQDLAVQAAIDAASDVLDPASGGWLGRALRPQTWELQLRSFAAHRNISFRARAARRGAQASCCPIRRCKSVDSVKYLDINGVDQTLVLGTDYRVLGMGPGLRQGLYRAAVRPGLAGAARR
jgi:hypothetical protein